MEEIVDVSLPEFDLQEENFSLVSNEHKVKSNNIHNLVSEFSQIKFITKVIIRHGQKGAIERKIDSFYSLDQNLIKSESISPKLTENKLKELIGKDSDRIIDSLKKYNYLSEEGSTYYLTFPFVSETSDDFHLDNINEKRKHEIFKTLNTLLWKKVSKTIQKKENPIYQSLNREHRTKDFFSLNDKEMFIFRFGNTLYIMDFYEKPSQELLELIDLKISLINQERMQNYFQIISTYSSDRAQWYKKDKRYLFYEIVGNFLNWCWNPFDMEECSLAVTEAGGYYSFARGCMKYKFNKSGEATWELYEKNCIPTIQNPAKEFLTHSMQVTINKDTIEPITIDLYMKSRSCFNVNPNENLLFHLYIRQLSEAIGKLIDIIIPIIQMEQAEETLKWRAFFDHLRIRSMAYGENIDKILSDSVRIIKWFFNIDDVFVYVENPEVVKMITIFRAQEKSKPSLYKFIGTALTKKRIMEECIIPIFFNDEPNETIAFYLKLPLLEESKNDAEEESYLDRTDVFKVLKKEAAALNIESLQSRLPEILATSISYNPTISLSNIHKKWHNGSKAVSQDILNFFHRGLNRFNIFFDLTVSIHSNIESGISRMRASRDRLTGLYNRQTFSTFLEKFFNTKKRSFGLMFIDLDTFKIFNDAISHHFGDKILIRLADLLHKSSKQIRQKSLAGRFGGDEFCFAVDGIGEVEFEILASRIFRNTTKEPINVNFFLEDRRERFGFDVNLIAFLHRIIRPDVGGSREIVSEFLEKSEESPRGHILNIFRYYEKDVNDAELLNALDDLLFENILNTNHLDKITTFLFNIVSEKLIRNYIFSEIDEEVETIIKLFIRLQLENKPTSEIRETIIEDLGKSSIIRNIFIRFSAGLSHSKEHRLRSVSSLFKAADSRAYIAKHNGKNCLYGVDSQKLI